MKNQATQMGKVQGFGLQTQNNLQFVKRQRMKLMDRPLYLS